MTILSGKSYYQIDKLDPEGYDINPFLPDGTIIKRIQLNFGVGTGGATVYLPILEKLQGQCLFDIVFTTDQTFERLSPINVIAQNTINNYIIADSALTVLVEFNTSAIFSGVSSTNYVVAGGFSII